MTPYYDDGQCVIYNADCREIVGELEVADTVVFDPPYNVGKAYSGDKSNDRLEADTYRSWLIEVLGSMSGRTLAYFPGAVNVPLGLDVLGPAEWTYKRMLGWHRKEFAGDRWTGGPAMSWEPILWAHRGESSYNRKFGHWGRDFLVVPSTHGDLYHVLHPCPKPYPVVKWLLGLFTPEGGTVLDPTMGTGTTLRAAKDFGYKAVGIEIDERYCEVAATRLGQEVLAL